MDFKPHEYQRHAIRWILDNPRCGLFLGMGLGKTVITLTALDWLINADLSVRHALVVAPKRVVTDTWAIEYKKWDHLRALNVVPIVGNPTQRKIAVSTEADIHLISRDNVKWLVEYLGRRWDFDTLVLDELSSFKNPQAARFKALKGVSKKCERVIGLTGTPAPNGYTDLWSQMYLIDSGERLGKTVTDFRRKYCVAVRYPQFVEYSVKTSDCRKIDNKIKDICMSMTAEDYLTLPPVNIINKSVGMGKRGEGLYKDMLESYVVELADKEITGSTAAVVSQKLLQIANGAIYDDAGAVTVVHDAKIDALEDLIEAAQGQPILLFYSFTSDKERITEHFPQARILSDDGDIQAWNNGEIPLLLAHPASAGHGLNLQAGGHIIVWFGLTWSLELYQQANARLNRQGQQHPVTIYHLISEGTIEEKVLDVLNNKAVTQKSLIDCVKAELKR